MSRHAVCSFVVLLLAVGCSAPTPREPTVPDLDLIDQGDAAVSRTGAVTFFSPDASTIGVTLDESPPDGRIDRVYRLQGARGIPERLPEPLDEARLIDQRRTIIVAGGSGPVRVLGLEELDPDVTMAIRDGEVTRRRPILRELQGDGEVASWIGLGLTQQIVGRDGSLDTAPHPPSPPPAVACQAGGPGGLSAALGCGGSMCRSTCAEGYYPCLRCTESKQLRCSCLDGSSPDSSER